MKYKFFFIPACWPEAAEESLNIFLAQHVIYAIDKQFNDTAEQAGWSFCIAFESSAASERKTSHNKNSLDYREILNSVDFNTFAELRRLRKQTAEEQAVPAYVVFSNEQLAEMVTRRVRTLEDLRAIDGVGQARCDRYGDAFLAMLTTLQSQSVKTSQEAL